MKPERKFQNATVRTDLKEKYFRYGHEVPASVIARQFDHLSEDEATGGFICYRKQWYHISDFMRCASDGWNGYSSDSFFSGTLIQLSNDGESYIIGTYCS